MATNKPAATVQDLMGVYIAFLRALSLVHQNNHWQIKGPGYYGNHLLLERLYSDTAKGSDQAAERAVGLFGSRCVNMATQAGLIYKIVGRYTTESDGEYKEYLLSSLKAEQDFLKLSRTTYEALKKSGAITLGLDDLIMATASNSEEHVYLLKQALDA